MKRFSIYCPLVAFLVLSLSLLSCEKKNEDIKPLPKVNLSYTIRIKPISKGDYLPSPSFSINQEKSAPGISIKSIKFYFDNVLIATASSQYHLSYQIQNETIGLHTLSAEISIDGGKNYSDRIIKIDFEVPIVAEGLDLQPTYVFDDENILNGLSNGDVLSGYSYLPQDGALDAQIVKVEYYWDSQLFATSVLSPFRFMYKIENQGTGKHIFSVEYSIYSKMHDMTFADRDSCIINIQ